MTDQTVTVDEFFDWSEAIDLVTPAKRIAVLAHINPDADAYGSMCALQFSLGAWEDGAREVLCLNLGGNDPAHQFIPGVTEVQVMPDPAWVPDLVIVCDCGDLKRVGSDLHTWVESQSCPILSLDHHASNLFFGTVNVVDTRLSSTSELIYLFIRALGAPLGADAAQCLLAGIIGDTGGFRYRSATAETLKRSAELMDAGASLHELTAVMYGSVPMSTIQLESFAFQNLRLASEGRVAGIVITEEDYAAQNAESADGEMLAEKIRDIQGVIISYSVRWMDKGWKVSMRTGSEEIDLTTVAGQFGGGGHRAAAAFRFSQPPEIVVPQLEKALCELL